MEMASSTRKKMGVLSGLIACNSVLLLLIL